MAARRPQAKAALPKLRRRPAAVRRAVAAKPGEPEARTRDTQYRGLVEQALTGVATVRADGTIGDINPYFAELLGLRPQQATGRRFLDFIPAGQQPLVASVLQEHVAGTCDFVQFEAAVLGGSAGTAEILVNATPTIVEGNPGSLVAIIDITERKRAEAALRASDDLLEDVERIAHIGGWHWDVGGDAVVWSEETYRIFGLDPAQPVRNVADFAARVHAEDRAGVARAISASTSRGAPFDIEFRAVRPDGSHRIVSTRAILERDAAGAVIGMTGTCHDITEAKQAEQKIREEATKFRSLVEQNVAGVIIVRRNDGTIAYVNPYFARLIGGRPAELIGRPLTQLLPNLESSPAGHQLREQLFGDLDLLQLTSEMVTKDGRAIDILVNASPAIYEGKAASILVVLDITEAKAAGQKIREEEAKFRSLVEQNISGIIIIRQDETIAYINPYWARLNGYSATETLGHPFLEYVPNEEKPRIRRELAKLARGKRTFVQLATSMLAKDGRRIDLLVNASAAIYEGRPATIAVLVDVTERRRAAQRLEASEERFRLVVEHAPDAILLYDFDEDRFISANRAAERLFACDREEILKHGPRHFYAVEQPDRRPLMESFDEHRNSALAGEELNYERRILNADGEERLCEVTLVRLRSETEKKLLRASFVDVTERKAAERALLRLNRALHTLSRGNEVVVHAKDEGELLREMCRALVEIGGYRMAWVGTVEHDAAKSVTPVASAGEIADYLEKAGITWADEPRGNGPHGRAIRSGEPQVTQDLAGDPSMAPWRAAADRCGFASSVVLPLKNGEVFAVLTIDAAEPDAFDEAALKLLNELAADLAYGIRSLRDLSDRAVAEKRWRGSLEAAIGALASMLDLRDPYTTGHQKRVAQLAVAIARELDLPETLIEGLALAGVVHDVGKITAPAEILNRPGRLTPLEYALIQGHAEAGYAVLKNIDFPWPIADIVRQHHERLDGSGYPQGLKGEAILPEAKILAVADVVEAMMSHRPYRPGLGLDAALAEIEQGKGTRYDPAAADACIALFRVGGFTFDSMASAAKSA